MNNKYKPVLEVFFLSFVAFLIHKLLFLLMAKDNLEEGFMYSIPVLYLFFLVCSIIILFILIRMKIKNIDSVGQTFLLLTSIKMVVAYILLYPILQSTNKLLTPEKTNFFITFAIFLTIETVVTIRILNKKQ
jgi:hypothetical protein